MKGENAKREIAEGIEAVGSVIARAGELEKMCAKLKGKIKRIYTVACGSSLAANYALAYWLREGNFEAEAIPSSEFYNYHRPIDSQTLVILTSQSGRTTETVRALEYAKKAGAITLSFTNFADSPLATGSDYFFAFNLQKEIAVMSTKAVDASLGAGYIFSKILIGQDYSKINSVPDILKRLSEAKIEDLVDMLKNYRSVYVIGSGLDYAGAMELSIKIGEGAMIQATPMYTLEVSHGPKAAASDLPAIIIALQPKIDKDYIRIIKEVKENRTKTILISRPNINLDADANIEIDIDPELSVFGIVKFAQCLALNLGTIKGIDPDSPPSLKKVVLI